MQTTQHQAYVYHTSQKRECQRKKQRARKKRRNRQRQEARTLMFRLQKTIDHHFPDLYEQTELVKGVVAKKRFRSYRVFGHFYQVVIDGTH